MADTHEIDGISYPVDWKGLVKDKPLMTVFKAYAKKAQIWESYMFLTRRPHNQKDYFTYIEPNAMLSLNISGTLRRKLTDLTKNGGQTGNRSADKKLAGVDWKNPKWTKLYDEAETDVRGMVNKDHLDARGKFWISQDFQKYHAVLVKKGAKKAARFAKKGDTGDLGPVKLDVRKLQSMLGFFTARNPKTQEFLKAMIEAIRKKDERTAKAKYVVIQTMEDMYNQKNGYDVTDKKSKIGGKTSFVPITPYAKMVPLMRKHKFLPKK